MGGFKRNEWPAGLLSETKIIRIQKNAHTLELKAIPKWRNNDCEVSPQIKVDTLARNTKDTIPGSGVAAGSEVQI